MNSARPSLFGCRHMSKHRWLASLIALLVFVACRDEVAERARERAAAERVAVDTAARAWNHSVGVDSVLRRGDTSVVWVSPTNWMATDAPQAAVRVLPGARIVGVQWIFGG